MAKSVPLQVLPRHSALHSALLCCHHASGRARRSQRCICSSTQDNVAWLEQASSAVRQDYDAVITLAGVPFCIFSLLDTVSSLHMGTNRWMLPQEA